MNHRHLLLKAKGLTKPPATTAATEGWLLRLVDAVHMRVLMGPYVTRCNTEGNEGITGVVVIETSHCSLHCWDRTPEPFFQLDLYSCADFQVRDVLDMVAEFGPAEIEWMLVDRNRAPELEELGSYSLPGATAGLVP